MHKFFIVLGIIDISDNLFTDKLIKADMFFSALGPILRLDHSAY